MANNQAWFIFQEGHHRGPFSLKQMQKFFKSGTVQEKTKIWKPGQNHWRNLAQYEEFKKIVRTLPLSDFDSPPPVSTAMFEQKIDSYPRLEDIVATSLLPEQKQELKRELKKELKKEIKGEIKPELSPRIEKAVKQKKQALSEELEQKMKQVVSDKVRGQQKIIRKALKSELKKELRVEITPQLGPKIQNEILNQREEIKHELKKELAPRIHAEVLDLRKKTEKEFKGQIVDTVVAIDHKLEQTIKKLDGQISTSIDQLDGQISTSINQLDGKFNESVGELNERLSGKFDLVGGKLQEKVDSIDEHLKQQSEMPPPIPASINEDHFRPRFDRPRLNDIPAPWSSEKRAFYRQEELLRRQKKTELLEKGRSWRKTIATVLVALPLAFAMIYFLIYLPTVNFERPLDMPDALHKEFIDVANRDLIHGVKRIAAFSYSGEKIFFTSNVGGEGHYQMKIESVPGKVLTTMPIKAVAKGSYQNKLVTFNRFTMIEGAKFMPGEYEVVITPEKFDWSKKLWDLFLKEPVKAPALRTKITWKGKDPVKYKTKIKKFLKRIQKDREMVLEEITQKYQTQIELLNLMQEEVKFAKTKRSSKKIFKNFYMREIGPILSSISLKNRESMAKVNLKNPEFYKKFETQLEFGKDIGALATDIIAEFKTKKLNNERELMERLVKLKEDIYLKTYDKPMSSPKK